MDTFFTLLKKGLVAFIFIVFACAATYVPQPYNKVKTVEAGPLTGGATLPMQIVQNGNAIATNVATTASAASNAVTSFASNSLWIKENLLDGIGWALAKKIVSSMVSSLINWINSGFQGSPAFVQDLQGFLLQAADEVMGEYIEGLGGIGSFICSPFRLDVQISVALQYQQARENQPAPTCTLSGIIDNIEGFIGGDFSEGGWKDWFTITSTPETYTPYGSMLSAQAGARAAIVNAQGEEIKLLEFGDGFLSGEICELVQGAGTTQEECFISKPGKIIEEALSFNLDSGRQSLIQADEINEIIAALLGAVANKALTGAAGLLGLSGGTGYTYSGYDGGSFTEQLTTEDSENFDYAAAGSLLSEGLSVQAGYRDLAVEFEPQLEAYMNNTLNPPAQRSQASSSRQTAIRVIVRTQGSFPAQFTPSPTSLIGRLSALNTEYFNPNTTNDRKLAIIDEYSTLNLYTEQELQASRASWENIVRPN